LRTRITIRPATFDEVFAVRIGPDGQVNCALIYDLAAVPFDEAQNRFLDSVETLV
jgi:hypothetical protein